MKFLLLLWVAIFANHGLTMARNPGLKLKLSEAGFNYAAKVAVDKLSADVTSKSIPDVSGSSGVLSYGMSNTRITGFTSPGSAVRTDAGSGITMALSNVGVSVHGNWNYHLKWLIFSLRDSGSFDVSVTGVTLRVSFGMGVDSNGRPTIHTKSCSCYVGNVNVKFHGGASWFYNIFSCVVEEKISDKIRSQLCTSLQNVINDKASKTLQNTKVRLPVNSVVTLDYSLVAAPEFGSNYLQLLHRGEFFWTSTNTGTTSLPPPIEDLPGPLKMVTFCMSDYVSNSLGYVLYRYGDFFLRHTLGEVELPASVRQIMKLANYPQIAGQYSAANIHLLMYATEQPTLHTNKDGIKGDLRGTVEIRIRLPTGKVITLLELDVGMELTITGHLTNERIISSVQHFEINIADKSGIIGGTTKTLINNLMNTVAQYFIVPKLNEVGRIGYPLPVLDNVKYINPQLHLIKDAFCFSTDLKYEP